MIFKWIGQSGRQYSFEVEPISSLFHASVGNPLMKPFAGVYIFARRDRDGTRQAVYVGETRSLHNRLNKQWESHHKKECILGNNPTELHILLTDNFRSKSFSLFSERNAIEQDLLKTLKPICNSTLGRV